jgi:hypothetical protein
MALAINVVAQGRSGVAPQHGDGAPWFLLPGFGQMKFIDIR